MAGRKSEIKVDTIIESFKKGKSITEISEETGYNRAYIYKLLKINNLVTGVIGRPSVKNEPASPFYAKLGEFFHFQRYYVLKTSENIVAKNCHSTPTRIKNIENGRYRLSLEEFNRICEGYSLRPDEVLRVLLYGN